MISLRRLKPETLSCAFLRGMVFLLLALASLPTTAQDQILLSDFNGTGFQSSFGFTQTIGPTNVRLAGATSVGGARIARSLDLSNFENARFSVDFQTNSANQASSFLLELVGPGQNPITGKWIFDVPDVTPGVPVHLVSTTNLGSPQTGTGDFNNLDLSQITAWQVLGNWSNKPFDLSFDNILIDKNLSEPPPYAGYEPDAPWRAVAASRIEANRKANAQFQVVDASGMPLNNAAVEVRMQQHEFGFGSAVQAHRLRDNSSQHATYKQKVAELFNIATLENNLKWPAWEGEYGSQYTQAGAIAALDWLSAKGIEARGHNIIWPGLNSSFSLLPADLRTLMASGTLTPAQQQQVRDRITGHINNITAATNGKVTAWDVVNEPRANHVVMDKLAEGDLAMVDWYQQMAAATPASLYLNEYDILASGGSTSSANQNEYFDTIEFLLNNGAPLDGIGFQGHFDPANFTGPEQLWEIIDRFATLGLDMQVTEFDVNTPDEQLQAAFTRDFLTAMFAHEAIDDVLSWGFWENAHWRPQAAMFRSDWSIKPNGEEFIDLVFNQWWTDEDLMTDTLGQASVRGFKGDYQVTVMIDGLPQVFDVTLSTDGTFELVLDLLAADFDHSGTVDGIDLGMWTSAYGTNPGGDADRDGDTDGADFLIWQRQFGMTTNLPSQLAVPEPSSLGILLGTICLAFYRPRNLKR